MSEKLLSIVITTYNRSDMLLRAINSVLQQSFIDYEVVIMDNHSTDDTYQKVSSIIDNRIRYYRNDRNIGGYANKKIGLSKSNSKYIVFLDDDDYYTNFNFFSNAVDALEKNEIVSIYSGSNNICDLVTNMNSEFILKYEGELNNVDFINGYCEKYLKPYSTFTSIFRKKSLLDSGIMELDGIDDSVIFLHALCEGNAILTKEICGTYTIHSSSMSVLLNHEFVQINLEGIDRINKIFISTNKVDSKWILRQVKRFGDFCISSKGTKFTDFIFLTKYIYNLFGWRSIKISVVLLVEFLYARLFL